MPQPAIPSSAFHPTTIHHPAGSVILSEVPRSFIASTEVEGSRRSPERHRRAELSAKQFVRLPTSRTHIANARSDSNSRQPLMLYNQAVRRLLAIAIALLIVLPTITPLFAMSNSADSTRPTCCRRDGKHHCMLMDAESSAAESTQKTSGITAATVSERCPYGSKSLPGTTHPDWSLQISEAIFAGILSHPSMAPQTESKRSISADRSRQKRGPPAIA